SAASIATLDTRISSLSDAAANGSAAAADLHNALSNLVPVLSNSNETGLADRLETVSMYLTSQLEQVEHGLTGPPWQVKLKLFFYGMGAGGIAALLPAYYLATH